MDITQIQICSSFFPELMPKPGEEAVGYSDEVYWKPGETLKIHFLGGTANQKALVAEYAVEWTRHANLSFEYFYEPSQPPVKVLEGKEQIETDIAVDFWDSGGGQSHIGTNSRSVSRTGQPSMYLPKSCDQGVILHEFGHALGLMHEHLNPGAPIKWNLDAFYQYYLTYHHWDKSMVDNNVLAVLKLDHSNYTLFDKDSIMIYEIPANLTLDGFSVKRQSELSAMDKAFIAEKYPHSG